MGRIQMGTVPRTEGMSFVTTPRTRSDLLKVSTMLRVSVSELINRALAESLSKYGREIQLYDNVFGEGDIPVKE